MRRWDPESNSEPENVVEPNVPQAAFKAADISSMQPSAQRKLFLRESAFTAERANTITEILPTAVLDCVTGIRHDGGNVETM